MSVQDDDVDVVIVGARVAGSVAAALLGDAGVRVLLVDSATFPSDTLSTHFFRGGGLVGVLDRLKTLDAVLDLGCPPLVKQWSYAGGGDDPVEQPPQDPGEIGYCLSVRREPLDQILLERAVGSGAVEARTGVRVVGMEREGETTIVRLKGREQTSSVRCRFVVGADGRHSSVAGFVESPVLLSEPGHRALYYSYVQGWRAPDGSDPPIGPEFSPFGDEIAYAFPSDAGLTCLAISVDREVFHWMRADLQVRFWERLSRHRAFTGRGAEGTQVVGSGPQGNYIRTACGPGWALIGDAGQHQDPWTGVGMDLAAGSAAAFADSFLPWLSGEGSEEEAGRTFTLARDSLGRDIWMGTVEGSRNLAG